MLMASLSRKYLLSLLSAGLFISALGLWIIYQLAITELSKQALQGAQLLSSAIDHSAMVAHDPNELDYIAVEIIKDQPTVQSILIATKSPFHILTLFHQKDYAPADDGVHMRNEAEYAATNGRFGHHIGPSGDLGLIMPLSVKPVNTHDGEAPNPVRRHGDTSIDQITQSLGEDFAISGREFTLPAADFRGVIIIRTDARSILQSAKNVLYRALPALLGGVFIFMALAYGLLRLFVLRPMAEIRDTMKHQEEGDKSARVGNPTDDEIGKVAISLNTMLDTLAESETARGSLTFAIDEIGEAIALYDTGDRLVFANRAWWQWNAGVRHKTKIGTTFQQHLQNLLEIGARPEAVGREEEWLADRLEKHANPPGPYELTDKDGRINLIHEQALSNGDRIFIASNVSEQRYAQQRLEIAIESINEGFVLFASDGRLIMCNTRYREINHVIADLIVPGVKFEELARGSISRGGLPDVDGREKEYIAERTKKLKLQQTHELQMQDGHWILISDSYTKNGEIVGIRTDITALKSRETALIAAKEAAELADRAKSDFLTHMSHELRTPLNCIVGFSDVMMNEHMGPMNNNTYKDYAQDIHRSGNHLHKMINEILDVSKIEAGTLGLIETDIELDETLASCIRMFDERARQATLSLRSDFRLDGVKIRGDETRIKQVFINLLSNAVKFTKADGLISVASGIDKKRGLFVSVSDNGVGIAEDQIHHVFQPFKQARNNASLAHEGTGLGLSLSKSLVELHGGTVEIESQINIGTNVVVSFPSERILTPSNDSEFKARRQSKIR